MRRKLLTRLAYFVGKRDPDLLFRAGVYFAANETARLFANDPDDPLVLRREFVDATAERLVYRFTAEMNDELNVE